MPDGNGGFAILDNVKRRTTSWLDPALVTKASRMSGKEQEQFPTWRVGIDNGDGTFDPIGVSAEYPRPEDLFVPRIIFFEPAFLQHYDSAPMAYSEQYPGWTVTKTMITYVSEAFNREWKWKRLDEWTASGYQTGVWPD